MNNPWHPQPGKHCLMCGEEALEYKYDNKRKVHILHCTNCKSNWYGRGKDGEADVKRQHKNGGAKKTS